MTAARTGRAIAWLIAAVVVATTTVDAASFRLRTTGAEVDPARLPVRATPADLLTHVAGETVASSGCATLELLELHQQLAGMGEGAPVLAIDGTAAYTAPDGRVRVRLDARALPPSPREGWPSAHVVTTVAETATAVLDFYVEGLGWRRPGSDAAPLEIAIVPLPDGVEGATVSQQGAQPGWDGSDATLLIDPRQVAHEGELVAVVAHQVAHALQLGYSASEQPWWYEASAIWLEDRAAQSLARHLTAADARLETPSRSLFDSWLPLARGSFLWAYFLAERGGDHPERVRQVWEELGAFAGPNLIEALDRTLDAYEGVSLEEAFVEFAVWNLFTGNRDDGQHYSIGSLLPSPPALEAADELPLRGLTPLHPYGVLYARLPRGDTRGGLLVDFDGGFDRSWQARVLVQVDGRHALAPVRQTARGSGELSLPWRAYDEAVFVLVDVSEPRRPSTDARLDAAYDPSIPFVLTGLVASPEADAIHLAWSTASEADLVGWNIYRSRAAGRGFERINTVPLPAVGALGGPVHYRFSDHDVHPDLQYHYYVEGLTAMGLADRTESVSVRALPVR